jgi:hypothetical protein
LKPTHETFYLGGREKTPLPIDKVATRIDQDGPLLDGGFGADARLSALRRRG